MFQDENLKTHLEESATIKGKSAVIVEWNMNIAENIFKIGNYRYRPQDSAIPKYQSLLNNFDEYDEGYFYTNATDADIVIDGGVSDTDENIPVLFKSKKTKESLLYSLEDCFERFRPRSGINKLRYFPNRFTHYSHPEMANRPRYYMGSKQDSFKYWTSYRTESLYKYKLPYNSLESDYIFGSSATYTDETGVERSGDLVSSLERGISLEQLGTSGSYRIDDVAPYIVYKDPVPSNRIIVKMQTGVGTVNLGPFSNSSGNFDDPFFGSQNQDTPVKWKVQYLDKDSWLDAISFDANSIRDNGSGVIRPDGYVELSYGLVLTEDYRNIFKKRGELVSEELLPEEAFNGDAYLIKANVDDLGIYYIYTNSSQGYEQFVPRYGWYLSEDEITSQSSFVTDLVSPEKYLDSASGKYYYREFKEILGLRVVVETMNRTGATFDLIELSPRLAVDLSDNVLSFSIQKMASDLGVGGLPVSQLLASGGSLNIFDHNQAFNQNNIWSSDLGTGSLIAKYITKNIQVKIYEIIQDVIVQDPKSGFDLLYDYYVPIKTMYSDGFPSINENSREVSLTLRDLYFYFESLTAPQLLIQNASASYAVSMLLDSIGFSNYSFKRTSGEKETVIPFFFVPPDTSIAQVLNDIAISTQTSMFFDEYNNFVMMSKDYMLPEVDQRQTDFILRGTKDFEDKGILENANTSNNKLSNIIAISSQTNSVYNDGVISYTQRSIKRTFGSLQQVSLLSQDQTWVYENSLLWEISGGENLTSINNRIGNQVSYLLTAIPLNTDLTLDPPTVKNFKIVDNVMDLGEGIYSIFRYNGYFYSNGEIIKYDAIQYSIPGISQMDPGNPNIENNNVWITSLKEYQDYFSKVPFNGKIYPTGLVRIYTEPNYEEILDPITKDTTVRLKNGNVAKHGRGQFGTELVSHSSGLPSYWSDNQNVRGCDMKSSLLFSDIPAKINFTSFVASNSNKTFKLSSLKNLIIGAKVMFLAEDGVTVTGSRSGFILSLDEDLKTITIDNSITLFEGDILSVENLIKTQQNVVAGSSNNIAKESTRNGIIKNYLSPVYKTEAELNSLYTTEPGTVQSSAFVFTGPPLSTDYSPLDFISYVYKPLTNKFKHFGTRLRIIGRPENSEIRNQTAIGSTTYYSPQSSDPGSEISISGASGGLGILVNPETNNGYYYEIIALNQEKATDYEGTESLHNIVFYKIEKDQFSEKAIPVKLWGTFSEQIITDSGDLTGQYRFAGDEFASVYDLAVEYEEVGNSLRFYLYLDGRVIGVVDDPNKLQIHNNMALFTRGASRCMFENIYSITNSYGDSTGASVSTPVNAIFDNDEVTVSESFKKYSMSGIIKNSYLSGISSEGSPKFNMYFEEFGTIMREAAYFSVKYDKAFPALYAKLYPTFNRIKGYTVSGFFAGAYGAEFLIFNSTDTNLSLDSSSGNYVRIQGITFTQESEDEYSVDDYFESKSNFSKPMLAENSRVISPVVSQQEYFDIKNSRTTYGRNEFTLATPYIQTQDDAKDLMDWMVQKIMKPRKSVGLEIFPIPTLQLGDIVEIDYTTQSDGSSVSFDNSRFVVYNIDYTRSNSGPTMSIYLSEVQ